MEFNQTVFFPNQTGGYHLDSVMLHGFTQKLRKTYIDRSVLETNQSVISLLKAIIQTNALI